MHVLQLVPSLEVGGVERGVLDVAKGLIARGHRVSVVSSGGAWVEPLMRLGATHVTMPIHHKSPWAMWQGIPALLGLVRATQVDVIHARSRVPAWIGYAVARRANVPFVTTCHGFYAPHPASRVMTWGRLVIVPSKALGRHLIDRFHLPPERLRVIPRGVDLSVFPFREPPPRKTGPWRIGLVGRLSALKGHEVAIRALHQLIEQRFPVTLCVIGDAPPEKPGIRHRLVSLAESLGVAQAIEWMGMRHEILESLQSLDALIMPSTYPESFGRSAIEAQAVGVPVVASRIGALAEMIEDGRTGLLVAPGDPSALASALTRLMQEPPLRHRLIHDARRRVEQEFALERMVDDTLAVYQACVSQPRIVVWKLSALGDVVLATPSLRAIRRHFPQSPITLVVGRACYEAVARCPYVNDVLIADPTRTARTLVGRLRFIRRLRRLGADLSIDLQNSRLTHLLAWLSGIPVRIGYQRRWGWLLNRAVMPPQAPMHPVAHQQHLLNAAGVLLDGEALELWPSEQDAQRVERLLQEAGVDVTKPIVGLHVGGSRRWKTKRWAPARWAALCDRLTQQGLQVVLTGSRADQPLGEQVLRAARTRPCVAIGQTRLMELACLIRRCQVYVTNDSAPLHIAAAMGTPTVALFGPTDPARHAPHSPVVRVIKNDVWCSPCYSTWCRTITHACMTRIRAEEVAESVLEMLSRVKEVHRPRSTVHSEKLEGRKQNAEGSKQDAFPWLLLSASCLLPTAFCLLRSS